MASRLALPNLDTMMWLLQDSYDQQQQQQMGDNIKPTHSKKQVRFDSETHIKTPLPPINENKSQNRQLRHVESKILAQYIPGMNQLPLWLRSTKSPRSKKRSSSKKSPASSSKPQYPLPKDLMDFSPGARFYSKNKTLPKIKSKTEMPIEKLQNRSLKPVHPKTSGRKAKAVCRSVPARVVSMHDISVQTNWDDMPADTEGWGPEDTVRCGETTAAPLTANVPVYPKDGLTSLKTIQRLAPGHRFIVDVPDDDTSSKTNASKSQHESQISPSELSSQSPVGGLFVGKAVVGKTIPMFGTFPGRKTTQPRQQPTVRLTAFGRAKATNELMSNVYSKLPPINQACHQHQQILQTNADSQRHILVHEESQDRAIFGGDKSPVLSLSCECPMSSPTKLVQTPAMIYSSYSANTVDELTVTSEIEDSEIWAQEGLHLPSPELDAPTPDNEPAEGNTDKDETLLEFDATDSVCDQAKDIDQMTSDLMNATMLSRNGSPLLENSLDFFDKAFKQNYTLEDEYVSQRSHCGASFGQRSGSPSAPDNSPSHFYSSDSGSESDSEHSTWRNNCQQESKSWTVSKLHGRRSIRLANRRRRMCSMGTQIGESQIKNFNSFTRSLSPVKKMQLVYPADKHLRRTNISMITFGSIGIREEIEDSDSQQACEPPILSSPIEESESERGVPPPNNSIENLEDDLQIDCPDSDLAVIDKGTTAVQYKECIKTAVTNITLNQPPKEAIKMKNFDDISDFQKIPEHPKPRRLDIPLQIHRFKRTPFISTRVNYFQSRGGDEKDDIPGATMLNTNSPQAKYTDDATMVVNPVERDGTLTNRASGVLHREAEGMGDLISFQENKASTEPEYWPFGRTRCTNESSAVPAQTGRGMRPPVKKVEDTTVDLPPIQAVPLLRVKDPEKNSVNTETQSLQQESRPPVKTIEDMTRNLPPTQAVHLLSKKDTENQIINTETHPLQHEIKPPVKTIEEMARNLSPVLADPLLRMIDPENQIISTETHSLQPEIRPPVKTIEEKAGDLSPVQAVPLLRIKDTENQNIDTETHPLKKEIKPPVKTIEEFTTDLSPVQAVPLSRIKDTENQSVLDTGTHLSQQKIKPQDKMVEEMTRDISPVQVVPFDPENVKRSRELQKDLLRSLPVLRKVRRCKAKTPLPSRCSRLGPWYDPDDPPKQEQQSEDDATRSEYSEYPGGSIGHSRRLVVRHLVPKTIVPFSELEMSHHLASRTIAPFSKLEMSRQLKGSCSTVLPPCAPCISKNIKGNPDSVPLWRPGQSTHLLEVWQAHEKTLAFAKQANVKAPPQEESEAVPDSKPAHLNVVNIGADDTLPRE